jgi:hypothetical protein
LYRLVRLWRGQRSFTENERSLKEYSRDQADPAKTISQINNGEGGFRDRDLYPSCAGPDGKNIAHPDPTRIGLVQKDIKDVNGKPYGAEFASATEGKLIEVTYMFPRPGEDKTPVEKVGLATKVAGYTCGVGYDK